jgi:hypothetical protein
MKSVSRARAKHPRFNNAAVAAVFDFFPPKIRARLLALRALIFDTAAATKGVGVLEETLRWGEPSYLTTQSQSGSMIRLNFRGGSCVMYFHCRTNLVARFREIYPGRLNYEGNRAILLGDGDDDDFPEDAIRHCVALALTYRLDRKKENGPRRKRVI